MKAYPKQDQLDDAVEGTQKWDRLRGQLTLRTRNSGWIDSYEIEPQGIRSCDTGGEGDGE